MDTDNWEDLAALVRTGSQIVVPIEVVRAANDVEWETLASPRNIMLEWWNSFAALWSAGNAAEPDDFVVA